jgi:hypothetical protein
LDHLDIVGLSLFVVGVVTKLSRCYNLALAMAPGKGVKKGKTKLCSPAVTFR